MGKIPRKLGEILVESKLVTEQQLLAALSLQENNKKPLGEILIEQGYIPREQLEAALAKQYGSKLGEILISTKIINFEQLQKAMAIQQRGVRALGEILIELGYISEDNLREAQAKQYNLRRVALSTYEINPDAFSKVPLDTLRHYQVVPIDIKDGFLVVATSNPEDILAESDLRFISGMDIKMVIASKEEILAFLE
jgi:MSHA biogenesis protein MshE